MANQTIKLGTGSRYLIEHTIKYGAVWINRIALLYPNGKVKREFPNPSQKLHSSVLEAIGRKDYCLCPIPSLNYGKGESKKCNKCNESLG